MVTIYVSNRSEAKGRRYRFMDNPAKGSAQIFLGLQTGNDRFYSPNTAIRELARYFPGATVYYSKGLWKGTLEDSVVFKIVNLFDYPKFVKGDDEREADYDQKSWDKFHDKIVRLATFLRRKFGQESVLVETLPPESVGYEFV